MVYSGESFGVFAFLEFLLLYATFSTGIRLRLDGILSLVGCLILYLIFRIEVG
jgi:hypothetical protein